MGKWPTNQKKGAANKIEALLKELKKADELKIVAKVKLAAKTEAN